MSMPKQCRIDREADLPLCRRVRHAYGSAAAKHVWPAIVVAVIAGCRQGNQFVSPPPPTVTVAHPVEHAVADTIEFVGNTQATVTVDLRARVNGYLERIEFDDGSIVKAGDVLFIIEQAPFKIALDAAKAALQKAVASQALAESQYRRMAPLVKNGVVTPEELDIQQAQVATSMADVASAEAAVKKADLDLSYTQITAPVAGRINRHLVDVGNLVQAEQTPLATIQAIDPIYAYFDLSENDLLRFMKMLRQNQLPDPDRNPPVLNLGLANEAGFPHKGRLDYRELNVDPSTGTALRRGIFPNPNRQLIPGMFVRIQASIGEPKPRLLVDERAIGTDQRGDYLLVVNEKNVVEYRTVQLGIHAGPLRVIDAGIHATDWVVVNGLQRARPGAKVTPERAAMTDAAATTKNATTPPAAKDAKAPAKPKADVNPQKPKNNKQSSTIKPAPKTPPPATTSPEATRSNGETPPKSVPPPGTSDSDKKE